MKRGIGQETAFAPEQPQEQKPRGLPCPHGIFNPIEKAANGLLKAIIVCAACIKALSPPEGALTPA